jgi:hypothetical protein
MPAALPKVLRRPMVEIADAATPTTRVDISCYINRDEATPNVENIDVGTHCNPGAQATGQITWEWTVDWRVSYGTETDPLSLQQAMAPFVGKECIIYERTDEDATQERSFTVEIPFNPANAGVWESGTNPNPSITYAIKSGEPSWGVAVVTAAAESSAKSK